MSPRNQRRLSLKPRSRIAEIIDRLDVRDSPGVGQRQAPSAISSWTHAAGGIVRTRLRGGAGGCDSGRASGSQRGNSSTRGSLPGALPRDKQTTRGSTPRRSRRSMSGVSGQPSSSRPSRPARNTTSDRSSHDSARPRQRGRASPPKFSRRTHCRFQGGVGIDAIMVYTDHRSSDPRTRREAATRLEHNA